MFFVSCAAHANASVHCCLVVTCSGMANFLAFVGDVYCIFVIFSRGIMGQVWYLIVSFPDLCRLSYFTYMGSAAILVFGPTHLSKISFFHTRVSPYVN